MSTTAPSAIALKDLASVQAHFHALIAQRAAEFGLPVPEQLPVLRPAHRTVTWFPVPGMYGGFSYRLVENAGSLKLQCDSWSRVSAGSEQEHIILATGTTQLPQQSSDLGIVFHSGPHHVR